MWPHPGPNASPQLLEVWMWHLETWFSGEHGGAGLMDSVASEIVSSHDESVIL